MNRRSFIAAGIATGAAMETVIAASNGQDAPKTDGKPFKLKYAPSLGSFGALAGKDLNDKIQFMHDQGFRAVFDNKLMKRPEPQQKQIASTVQKLGMDLGPFVGFAAFGEESFVSPVNKIKADLVKAANQWVEVSKRTAAKY